MEFLKARYCLLYWYHDERNWSVQTTSTIKWPLRDQGYYQKGMLVMARFQGKMYRAAIVRIEDEKDDLIADQKPIEDLLKDLSLTPKMVCERMGLNVDPMNGAFATNFTSEKETAVTVMESAFGNIDHIRLDVESEEALSTNFIPNEIFVHHVI